MANWDRLAEMFIEIAKMLEFKGDNPFKIRAYQMAAHTIEQLKPQLDELVATGGLEGVKGIGKAIAEKTREFSVTGSIAYYEELKGSIPPVLFELTRIPGLGAKKASLLVEQLGIHSIGELEYACRENRLLSLTGFGIKSQEKILQGIEFLKRYQGRFLLSEAWSMAEQIVAALRQAPEISQVEYAGSVRRRKEIVKDIDIVVTTNQPAEAEKILTALSQVEEITSRGGTKLTARLVNGMNMDVRVVKPEEFAATWHHLTGSKEHHIELRSRAKKMGYKINEYNVEKEDGREIQVLSEASLYELLKLAYIEPELREGLGEVEAAESNGLPELIDLKEIRGALHVHTTDSDGAHSLREMAQAAEMLGWEYIGVTDHSQSAVYARGLRVERVLEQRKAIDRLNEEFGGAFTVFSGIESDILPDGSLDYPDSVLAGFDFVIASVHSAFHQSEADMTQRIKRAMENPYVSILGHPTGRILLAREGYAIDVPAVLATAAATGTSIEINASPYRLDLDWRWCREAKERGILLSIDPDAHSREELGYMQFGVWAARKGWLSRSDILNTRRATEAKRILSRKRPNTI